MIYTKLLELEEKVFSERIRKFWKKEKLIVTYFEDSDDKIILDVILTSTSEHLPLDEKWLELLDKN